MNLPELILVFASLLSVALVWRDPRGHGQDYAAGVTLVLLALVAPLSALWLAATVLVTFGVMRAFPCNRGTAAGLLTVVLAAALLYLREQSVIAGSQILWMGAAYFTLRMIHVVMDWWLLNTDVPSLRLIVRYSFFAPVILAGPIHRLPNFERSLARRRWDPDQFYSGAERALFGAVLAFVIGEFAYSKFLQELEPLAFETFFLGQLFQSAMNWIFVYLAFSGLTSLSLGLAAMMGLKLEENFNRPYAAIDLIDFWQRWHITLSLWCKDYVFVPISTSARSPVLGVIAAMLVLGVWHETSYYYILWAMWQALGIILTHRFIRPCKFEAGFALFAIRVVSFLWLVLANPIAMNILEIL